MDVIIPEELWGDDSEGVISAWLFEDGESVSQGGVLAEVMNAKAVMELVAPASGRLSILVAPETPVRRGQIVARIA
jgi:pyruvate/2-oxoglutarate dehydrogenase complex dihydrolipoamide acyltransferase (E2) component